MRARFPFARLFCLATALAGIGFVQPRVRSGAWRIVMLPDTQQYSVSATDIVHFEAQTQWIADHLALDGIEFVTHVGDIVQMGAQGAGMNQVEWDRAVGAMATLDGDLDAEPDGIVPYSAVIGNHDYDVVGDKGSALQFRAHFGPQRYAGRSWFEGASPSGTDFAQRFVVEGSEFLALGLEWLPSDESLAWAQALLDAHPRLPVVLTTHEYLELGAPASRRTTGDTPDGSGDNSGESVYRKLVEPNPQIFLVLCGHVPGDGRATSSTALGATVHEVLADYQADANGGNGWMKLVELRELAGEIESVTFSPTYVPGVSIGPDRSLDPSSNFVLPFDFAAHRVGLEQRELRRFRAGLGGASFEVHDTHVGDGGAGITLPDVAHGALDTLRVDGDGDREQALLRFADFVGTGPGQVPPGVLVERAILTLTTEGPVASSSTGARLHRMRVDWGEDSTWDSLGAGVQLGPEASPVVELDVLTQVATNGTDSFDVTASVQGWVDGDPNHGWVVLASGTDRWEARSSEWPALAERPMLTVLFSGACRDATRYCIGAPNSAGAGAQLDHSGSTSVSANDLVLTASGLPPFQPALFFYGPMQARTPFGDGFMCVAPGASGIFRLIPPIAADSGGNALRRFALDAPPANAGPGAIEAGSTWNVQLWYRDPASGASGFNLSDALALHFCE